MADVLTGDERTLATELGADRFFNSERYKKLRDKYFEALDAAALAMEGLEFPDPYNGRVLGALASVIFRNDSKSVGVLQKYKVKALHDLNKRKMLFEYVGMMIAEKYLDSRKNEVTSTEPPLIISRSALDGISSVVSEMVAAGEALSREVVYIKELDVALADPEEQRGEGAVRAVIEAALDEYEALVSTLDDDDEIPNDIERRSISRAAFLRVAVNDLARIAFEEGLGTFPNKRELVDALTNQFGNDLDAVARLIVERQAGDLEYGLVTRLVPLREAPDLAAARDVFASLIGHYVEVRTALFFIFLGIGGGDGVLTLDGRIKYFTVNPNEAGGEAQINARLRTERVAIVLRDAETWAEVTARTIADLRAAASVLRRSGVVMPMAGLQPPDPLTVSPYDTWDPRTLWVLDFLRRDLQSDELRLDDTPMANFVNEASVVELTEEELQRPNIDAVRLLGRQLHEHPEASARIASRAHLRDIEVALRQRVDASTGESRLVRARLSWESDHLAILSASDAQKLDAIAHDQLVRLVRNAGDRPLDQAGLMPSLNEILRRAEEGTVEASDRRILE